MAELHQKNVQNERSAIGNEENGKDEVLFKVYKRRWLMLFIVFFLNVSNGAIWMSFASITFQATNYFGVDTNAINWFSMVFFITTIPVMFVTTWLVDRFGFKVGVQSGCFLNAAGSVIRLFGTLDIVPAGHMQYVVVLTGQTIASMAQPFAMSLPPKVSEVWFPPSQRTLATTLCASGNPLGFMVASLVAPSVVSDAQDVPIPNEIFSAMGILSGLLGLLVWQAKPTLPPSNTAEKPERVVNSYARSLGKLLTNKAFVVLMFAAGGGMGLISVLQTMMDQMLCSWGYTDDFAGLCSALMVVGGLLGSGMFFYIAERTKRYEELISIVFAVTVVFLSIFIMIFHIRDIEWAIAITVFLFGFVTIGIYPICLEVGVETTYPIDESIGAGAIVVVGQLLSAVFLFIMEALEVPLTAGQVIYQKCQSEVTQPANLINAGLFVVACTTVISISLMLFFRPKYRRAEAEKMPKVLTTAPVVMAITSQETILQNTDL